MSNLQIRNVDPDLHDQLRRRVDDQGVTISDYLLGLIRRDLQRPARGSWLSATAQLPRHEIDRETVAEALATNRACP